MNSCTISFDWIETCLEESDHGPLKLLSFFDYISPGRMKGMSEKGHYLTILLLLELQRQAKTISNINSCCKMTLVLVSQKEATDDKTVTKLSKCFKKVL